MSYIQSMLTELSCSEKPKSKIKREPIDNTEDVSTLENDTLSGKVIDFQFLVQPKQEDIDVKLELDTLYLEGEVIEPYDEVWESINSYMRLEKNNQKYFCTECNESFPFKEHDVHKEYMRIINQRVNEENPYVCKECNIILNTPQNAVEHLYLHDKKKFSCNHCAYSGKTLSELKCHMETVHSEIQKTIKTYCCNECDFKSHHHLSLRKHIDSKHNDINLYHKCKQCDGYWPDKDHMLHEKMIHINKKRINKQNPFVCKECKLELIETSKVYEHIKLHGDIGFYCNLCVFSFDKLSELELHKQNEHLNQLNQDDTTGDLNREEAGVSNIKCSQCDLYWPDGNHGVHLIMLEITKREISEENPYMCFGCKKDITDIKKVYYHVSLFCKKVHCDQCSYMSDQCFQMERHKRRMHPQPYEVRDYQFFCNLCDYKTDNRKNYIAHKEIHKGVSERVYYNCDECNFKTAQCSYLKKHKRLVHEKDKETEMHTCKDCGYSSTELHYLKKHMDIHRNDKVYCCELCSFETRTNIYLERHKVKMHTAKKNTKTYVCEECAKEFKFKPSLTKHLAVFHKRDFEMKKFICYTCNYENISRQTFISHVLRHRKRKEVMYCANCEYKTQCKNNLVQHMVKHADPAKMKMYKCSICSFTTKRPHTLRHHVKTH